MAKYEHRSGGILFTIERALLRGGTPWHATRKGETLATGQTSQEVLDKLVADGIADQERLPKKLHDWNEVRDF